MIIRKQYRTEGPAHVVRNCTTDRCSKSIHGHTYKWEVMLEGHSLDFGGMLVDFGILGGEVKQFFDMFDHCHAQWEKDLDQPFFQEYSERYIKLPFSPSAENLSLFALKAVTRILSNTVFANGEQDIYVKSVRCHETETGWAEAFESDLIMAQYSLEDVLVKHEADFWLAICNGSQFVKSTPEHQL